MTLEYPKGSDEIVMSYILKYNSNKVAYNYIHFKTFEFKIMNIFNDFDGQNNELIMTLLIYDM